MIFFLRYDDWTFLFDVVVQTKLGGQYQPCAQLVRLLLRSEMTRRRTKRRTW